MLLTHQATIQVTTLQVETRFSIVRLVVIRSTRLGIPMLSSQVLITVLATLVKLFSSVFSLMRLTIPSRGLLVEMLSQRVQGGTSSTQELAMIILMLVLATI